MLCVRLPLCASPSVCLSTVRVLECSSLHCSSVRLLIVRVSVYPFVRVSVCSLSVCSYIHFSTCPSIFCPCIRLVILYLHLSVYSYFCLLYLVRPVDQFYQRGIMTKNLVLHNVIKAYYCIYCVKCIKCDHLCLRIVWVSYLLLCLV